MNPEKRLLSAFLLVSVLLMAAAFVISGYANHIAAARYLAFTAFAVLMLVALFCPWTKKGCIVTVLLLLIVSAAAGGMYVSTRETNPNGREYSLIAKLEDQNLSFGYGTYWDANIITYLSGERVVVRSTYFSPDSRIAQDRHYSCDQWYMRRPETFFLVYDRTRFFDDAQKDFPLLIETINSSTVLQTDDYDVALVHSSLVRSGTAGG